MSTTHHPKWLVILRMVLGLMLLAKGILFIHDSTLLDKVLYGATTVAEDNTHWLPIVITWAHLLGGLFILIGIFTRPAIVIQIPVLVGAVVLIAAQTGLALPKTELYWSIACLALALTFLAAGRSAQRSPLAPDAKKAP